MNDQNAKDNTIDFYNDNAQAFVEQTLNVDVQALYEPFIASLPATNQSQQRILDLGCGSGRDSLHFADLGFKVTAIDDSTTLIDLAKNIHYRNKAYRNNIDWHRCTFQDISQKNWKKQFIGIWACASLLHMPYAELPVLIDNLLDTLANDGVFYASFKYGDSERLKNNRFFCDMNEDRWESLKQKLNHDFNDEIWLTEDQRTDRNGRWFNILIKR